MGPGEDRAEGWGVGGGGEGAGPAGVAGGRRGYPALTHVTCAF